MHGLCMKILVCSSMLTACTVLKRTKIQGCYGKNQSNCKHEFVLHHVIPESFLHVNQEYHIAVKTQMNIEAGEMPILHMGLLIWFATVLMYHELEG